MPAGDQDVGDSWSGWLATRLHPHAALGVESKPEPVDGGSGVAFERPRLLPELVATLGDVAMSGGVTI